jgi:O-succinylbenzoic acid--CoA ligase
MNKKYYISGKEFGKDELLKYCKEKLANSKVPSWEKDVYDFIMQWFDGNHCVDAHTSGTTGKPKEIKLPKELMKLSAQSTVSFFQLKQGDTALLCLSVNYIAGKMMVVRALECGLNLLLCEPGIESLKQIDESIDFCAMVPYQVSRALEKFPGIFTKINTLIIGGARVSSDLEERLQSIETKCYSTYGMTETMSHIALMKLNCGRENMYRCLPNIEISTDNRGCLVIKSWGGENIVTNDIVEKVGDNTFIWQGRYDNVINSGGIKLIPEVLEQKVSGFLTDRYVFTSLSDEYLGDKLVLLIESAPYSEDDLKSLKENLKTKLGKYEMPKQILFMNRFKETTSGKIIRNGLFK